MSKEVYIALIQKDIKELDVIAQGLYETDFPSPTVIKLASSKAMDIVNNLQRLSAVKQEESKAEKALEAYQRVFSYFSKDINKYNLRCANQWTPLLGGSYED